MGIQLSATSDGKTVKIFADIFPVETYGEFYGLCAKPITFGLKRLYEQDNADNILNNTLLELPLEEARKFAKQILRL